MRKCPKCRSIEIIFNEQWDGQIFQFEEVRPNEFKVCGWDETGNPSRVDGQCLTCGHRWKVPGATQIINMGEKVQA